MGNKKYDHCAHQNTLPVWFEQPIPDISNMRKMQAMFRGRRLATVCETAHCPNMGQCWGRGVATFMILGEICTRACRFCAVQTGAQPSDVHAQEPEDVADMVCRLGLKYVVITSVTRDDLPDEGAQQFVRTVSAIRHRDPAVRIELLIPDFSGKRELIDQVVASQPDVIGHNIEMARWLFPEVRPQADYDRSLGVLKTIRMIDPTILIKSGFMVGLGESDGDVEQMMLDLRAAGCDMLTIGQYLAPSQGPRHVPVARFVTPEQFVRYAQQGKVMGFHHVLSAPLVRSSFIAEEGYRACQLKIMETSACHHG